VEEINRVLRGHHAYFGSAGNIWSLKQVHRRVERYWYKMLCGRSSGSSIKSYRAMLYCEFTVDWPRS
jgi:hypothetical protein